MRINRSQWITAAVLAGVICAISFAGSQKPGRADVALEAAAKKEMVDGDLRGAIEQYKKIIATYASDRAIAAKALVRMAQCYEKLGDQEAGEARRAYERVLSDYPDQKEAVSEARARLGRYETAQHASAMSSRQVWTLPGSVTVYGTVSHDGRYLPYTDWATPGAIGELFLHDMATGADRRITHEVEKPGEQYPWDVTFSPDDTQLAYAWFNKDYHELRIVGLKAPGVSPPRILFSDPEVPRISPADWSADGRWLGVDLTRKDKTAQIGLVAVKDGSLRILKSLDQHRVAPLSSSRLFFSPDSKYLACDLADMGNRRDVFVLAVDGSREIPAVVHPGDDALTGWSPDGRYLIFTSDRTGSRGLWALAFADGKPQQAPEQIKVDIAGDSLGVTSKGALYSLVHHANFGIVHSNIQVAAFDFAKGRFLSTPVSAVETFVGANNFPAWSPDGKSLAFLSQRGSTRFVIVILSHDTGQTRELPAQVNVSVTGLWGQQFRWSPDGRFLAVPGTDTKGRQGIFRIDATTGEATPIALSSRGPVGGGTFRTPVWAPDARTIYYCRLDPADAFTIIVERELSSGNEKEVIRRSRSSLPMDMALSPDGRYWAALDGDWFAPRQASSGTTRKWNVLLIPARGGEPRELMSGGSLGAGVLMWSPDSRSFFVCSIKDEATGNREIWRVWIDGSEPQKLDLNVNFLGSQRGSDQQLHPHPDGKRVVFAATEPARPSEVWVLENFLPVLNKRKK